MRYFFSWAQKKKIFLKLVDWFFIYQINALSVYIIQSKVLLKKKVASFCWCELILAIKQNNVTAK
jgi:hypothetical protein